MIAQNSPSWFIYTMPIICPPPVTDLVLINSCSTTSTLSCFLSFLHVIWLFLFMYFAMGPIGRQLSSYIGPSISIYTYILYMLYYFLQAEIVNKILLLLLLLLLHIREIYYYEILSLTIEPQYQPFPGPTTSYY